MNTGDARHRALLTERLRAVVSTTDADSDARVSALMTVVGPMLGGFEYIRGRIAQEKGRAQVAEERATLAEAAADAGIDMAAGRPGAASRFSCAVTRLDAVREGREPADMTTRRELLLATAAIRNSLDTVPEHSQPARLLTVALDAVASQKAEMLLRDGVAYRHSVQCWRSARYRGTPCSCARHADGLLWQTYGEHAHEGHDTLVEQTVCVFLTELDSTKFEYINERLWAAVEFAWQDDEPTPAQLDEVRDRLVAMGFADVAITTDWSHKKMRIRYQFVPTETSEK